MNRWKHILCMSLLLTGIGLLYACEPEDNPADNPSEQEDPGSTTDPGTNPGTTTVSVTGVTLDQPTLSLEEGQSAQLTATIAPSDATNQKYSWTSSDEAVATVADGLVTAVKAGSATITVTTEDGNFTATCEVTVTAKPGGDPGTVSVTGISLDQTTLSLEEGQSAQLKATITPADATNQKCSWKSSDESVAKVADGLVTAVKAGSATIVVITEDGNFTAACEVTVTAKPGGGDSGTTVSVTGITLDQTTLSLEEGQSAQLKATVAPSNATNQKYSWKSSDESVAKVADGLVTAVKAGSATITVVTEDGNFTATCAVTVKAKSGGGDSGEGNEGGDSEDVDFEKWN